MNKIRIRKMMWMVNSKIIWSLNLKIIKINMKLRVLLMLRLIKEVSKMKGFNLSLINLKEWLRMI